MSKAYKIIAASLLLLSVSGMVSASEISGTLSTGNGAIQTNSSGNLSSSSLTFTVVKQTSFLPNISWDFPAIVKVSLVGGVVLELLTLLFLNLTQRRRENF